MSGFRSINENSNINDLADLFEIFAIKNNRASKSDIKNYLDIQSDNDLNTGIEDNDSKVDNKLDSVLEEIARRKNILKDRYPFEISDTGTSIIFISPNDDDYPKWTYLYLLLSTRTNMRDNKVLNGIDGTLVLEYLSAEVLANYLGDHSKTFVFGTSAQGKFAHKVNELCRAVQEGEGHNQIPTPAQDGKLDIVGWIPFADQRISKLIIFGQCKTGTNWKSTLQQLQPDAFIKKFIKGHFSVTPMRSFFISQSIEFTKWREDAIDAGILFDRYRIVEFCPQIIDENLFNQLKSWTEEAINIADI